MAGSYYRRYQPALPAHPEPVKYSHALIRDPIQARRFQQDLIEWAREMGENWALKHPDVNVPTSTAPKKKKPSPKRAASLSKLSPGPTFSELKPKNAAWMRNLNTSMLNRKLPNVFATAAPPATTTRRTNTARSSAPAKKNTNTYNNKNVAARIAALQAALKRTANRPPPKIRLRSPAKGVKSTAASNNFNFNKQMAALNAAMASLKSETSDWKASATSRSRPASPSAANARAAISLASSSNANSNTNSNNGNKYYNAQEFFNDQEPWPTRWTSGGRGKQLPALAPRRR